MLLFPVCVGGGLIFTILSRTRVELSYHFRFSEASLFEKEYIIYQTSLYYFLKGYNLFRILLQKRILNLIITLTPI